ncbi:UDP-N-acetylmuramate dehydrogenase [Rickettsia endosymbiont of Cardiosporidium cionae]|uniref:UDP-N-acetylmuramate dehydrogenase n=1 Tax=Rickettsia endosymbiont of Cardiosporidium cionae TaxID=2777155 RepID=UPI001E404CC9|nr:UDP-N-acetylmuramate dehydrogenase [Rickettsia endosymbiont of Cardiosporidium cionae]KAF8818354.1 UDP-N-acetylenolpyruvoylglucosamine reductase [Rickettsia endosymbiont of Cardiosporidium cionae]
MLIIKNKSCNRSMEDYNGLFSNISGKYRYNYNISHNNRFKIGGNADVFFQPKNLKDLQKFFYNNKLSFPISIIGAGSNILVSNAGISGIVIRLSNAFSTIKFIDENKLFVGAGCLNYNLVKFAQLYSVKNFEFLIGIPGTVGGGIAMNAGAYGREFKDIILSVQAMDYFGNIVTYSNEECGFGYRSNRLSDSLIYTGAVLKVDFGNIDDINQKISYISYMRSSSQPINSKTIGSFFKNPRDIPAWKLIDNLGLRGKSIGEASVSKLHCNFIVNLGNASSSDIISLANLIISKVSSHYNIDLKLEVKKIGIF